MPATTTREDARAIRKLIREAEAVSDEVMIACARLKQAMVRARQNPDISVDAGQRKPGAWALHEPAAGA